MTRTDEYLHSASKARKKQTMQWSNTMLQSIKYHYDKIFHSTFVESNRFQFQRSVGIAIHVVEHGRCERGTLSGCLWHSARRQRFWCTMGDELSSSISFDRSFCRCKMICFLIRREWVMQSLAKSLDIGFSVIRQSPIHLQFTPTIPTIPLLFVYSAGHRKNSSTRKFMKAISSKVMTTIVKQWKLWSMVKRNRLISMHRRNNRWSQTGDRFPAVIGCKGVCCEFQLQFPHGTN